MRLPIDYTEAEKSVLQTNLLSIPELLKRFPINLQKYEYIRAYLHQHPEFSTQERNTAAFVVVQLSVLRVYEIHERIGDHGVAAVFHNGPGSTVLLRADMDALPVREQTGLPYASKVEMRDTDGVVKPVMHACGHDTHVTSLLAAAERLVAACDHWKGTLVLVFQPDEERSGGAQRMVDDSLYQRIPIPDILLGQHVMPQRSGRLGMISGVQLSASDSLKVTLHGRGGHASQPYQTIDPVVMMASCILRLQTIVSREVDTSKEVAVVTVGRAVAGEAENVIPDTAMFTVNIRTTDDDVRNRVLASVKRTIRAEADASGAEREPTIEILSSFPNTVNDPVLTWAIGETFKDVFGDQYQPDIFPRVNGSEDFPALANAIGRPYVFWMYGGTDPDLYDEAEREGRLQQDIPTNHSPFFAPVMQPTLKVAIDAMTSAALTFLLKH